jgi:hypothetical protein
MAPSTSRRRRPQFARGRIAVSMMIIAKASSADSQASHAASKWWSILRLCRPYNQAFFNRSNLLCRGTSRQPPEQVPSKPARPPIP